MWEISCFFEKVQHFYKHICTLDSLKCQPSWIGGEIRLPSTSENKPYGIHSLCEKFCASLKKCTIVISTCPMDPGKWRPSWKTGRFSDGPLGRFDQKALENNRAKFHACIIIFTIPLTYWYYPLYYSNSISAQKKQKRSTVTWVTVTSLCFTRAFLSYCKYNPLFSPKHNTFETRYFPTWQRMSLMSQKWL